LQITLNPPQSVSSSMQLISSLSVRAGGWVTENLANCNAR
jgi:hypothetical protein